jgi:hypothetical protein
VLRCAPFILSLSADSRVRAVNAQGTVYPRPQGRLWLSGVLGLGGSGALRAVGKVFVWGVLPAPLFGAAAWGKTRAALGIRELACGRQAFIATWLFDPSMSALPIILKQNSVSVGLFTLLRERELGLDRRETG